MVVVIFADDEDVLEPRRGNWWFYSRTTTMPKLPGCFSTLTIVPTLPVMRPFVIMHVMPTSNLMESTIFDSSRPWPHRGP